MDGILPQDSLGIADRLRRTKGRDSRTRSLASRFTPAEERELIAAAAREGKFTAEWTREALLRAARAHSTDGAVITELVALRMLLSTVLRSVALGETVTPEAYAQILAEVRAGKHDAARDVLDQYRNPTKEQ
jgi:hypothetical protein